MNVRNRKINEKRKIKGTLVINNEKESNKKEKRENDTNREKKEKEKEIYNEMVYI